jgi:hypothetical protein
VSNSKPDPKSPKHADPKTPQHSVPDPETPHPKEGPLPPADGPKDKDAPDPNAAQHAVADEPGPGAAPYSPGPSQANRPDRPDPSEIPPDFHLANPKGGQGYVAGQPVSDEEFDYTQEQAMRRKAHGDKMAKDAIEASEKAKRDADQDAANPESSAGMSTRDLSGHKPEEDEKQLRPHDRNSPEIGGGAEPQEHPSKDVHTGLENKAAGTPR